jgi:hypothetical protein
MDQAIVHLIEAHLHFMQWFASGIGVAIGSGATVIFKFILIPMRDSYVQQNLQTNLILTRIGENVDSTRSHMKELKEQGTCKYNGQSTLQVSPAAR